MRIVDIYREEGSQLRAVAFDCIQLDTGGSFLTRTQCGKLYTMANGAPFLYPSERDKATMTVRLECTKARARAIENAVHFGRLILAGLCWGTETRAAALPPESGVPCWLTGGVHTEQKYTGTDIFSVSLPLWLETDDSGSIAETAVPVIRLGALQIGSISDTLQMYRYSARPVTLAPASGLPANFFVRKNPVFIDADTVTLTYEAAVPEGVPEDTVFSAFVSSGNRILDQSTETAGSFSFPLRPRENNFLLSFYAGNYCKPMHLQLMIYKKG